MASSPQVIKPFAANLNADNYQVVFILDNLADWQTLAAAAPDGSAVVLLDGSGDALAQMADFLTTVPAASVAAIHLFSHGSEGSLQLGSTTLNSLTLTDSTEVLSQIGSSLSAEGDILLYGCNVGKDEQGVDFIQRLALLTTADVAASNDITGAADLGGNWVLEEFTGNIEPTLSEDIFINYAHALDDTLIPPAATVTTFDGATGGRLAFADPVTLSNVLDTGWDLEADSVGKVGIYAVTDSDISYGGIIEFESLSGNLSYFQIASNDVSAFNFTSIDLKSVNGTEGRYINVSATGYKKGVLVATKSFTGTSGINLDWKTLSFTDDSDFAAVDTVKFAVTISSGDIGTIAIDNIDLSVNAAPTIAIDDSTIAYTENAAAVQIDAAGTLSDSNGDSDWDGGKIEVQITANAEAADVISISDTDADVTAITISGTNIFANSVDIGDLSASSVTNNTKLTITFDSDATNANVQEVLQSLRYNNSSDAPSTDDRTVTITATDTKSASVSDTRTIAVTAVNDAPVLDNTKAPALTAINQNLVAPTNGSTANSTLVSDLINTTTVANYSDADGDAAAIAVTGINTNGTLYFSTDNGATWTEASAVSNYNALLLHADDQTYVYFKPDTNYSGQVSDAVTFKDWDRSGGYSNGQTGVDTGSGSSTVTHLSELALSGYSWGVAVSGNYAYVAADAGGLKIIDITDPLNPTLKATYAATAAADVAVSGNYAYVADGAAGLQVIDISNPAVPTLKWTYNTSGTAWGVTLDENYAYIADDTGGLVRLNVGASANPDSVPGSAQVLATTGKALNVAVSGDYYYVADYAAGLKIMYNSGTTISTISTYNTGGVVKDVVTAGNYAYVAYNTSGLKIIDISNPAAPTLTSILSLGGLDSNGIAIEGNYVYVASSTNGLKVVDVSDPLNPTLISTIDVDNATAQNVAVYGNYVYVADSDYSTSGLHIIDISCLKGDSFSQETDSASIDINSFPTITGTPSELLVTEDLTSNLDLSDITIADTDNDNLAITLTATAGVLEATSAGGVEVTGSTTGTLTLTGTASNINAYLDTPSNLKYTSASNASGNNAATISISASDGNGGIFLSDPSINLNITAVNDAPILVAKAPVFNAIAEDLGAPVNGTTTNSTLVSDIINTDHLNNFSDVDGDSPGLAITGVNENGTLYYSTNAGASWAEVGAVSDSSARVLSADANTRLYFQPSANFSGSITDAITFMAWDRTSYTNGQAEINTATGTAFSTATDTASIAISAVGDTPGVTTATTNEDTQTTDGLVISRNSVDSDEVTNFKITNINAGTLYKNDGTSVIADGAFITVAEGNAGLKFTPALNSTSAGTFDVQAAPDATGSGLSTAATATITVNAINDDPTMTGQPENINVDKNVATNLDLSGATFADVDSATAPITLTLSAADGSLTAADADGVTVSGTGTGTLTLTGTQAEIDTYLNTPAHIQFTGSAGTTLTLTANDAGNTGTGGGADVSLGSVTLTTVNTSPIVTAGGTTSFSEQTPVAVASSITLNDPNGDEEWNTGTLNVQITANNTADDSLTLPGSNPGSTGIWLDGSDLKAGDTQIGTASATSVSNGTAWTFTFNASATNSLVQDTARAIQFVNPSDAPDTSSRTVTFTVTDSSSASSSATQTVTVALVNDAPVLDADSYVPALNSIAEDVADGDNSGTSVATMVADGSITDPDGSPVEAVYISSVDNTHGTWQYKVGAGSWTPFDFTANSGKELLLDSTDSIRFVPALDFSGEASLTFGAWDKSTSSAGSYVDLSTATSTATDTATITVTDVTESLSIDDPSVTEGDSGTAILTYTVTLNNPSASTVTVAYGTLDGTAGINDYTPTTGTLTFNPGETSKTIAVTVLGDEIDEGASETVGIDLRDPVNAIFADSHGEGTITDDDTAGFTLSATTATVDEWGATDTFTVVLDTQPISDVVLDVASADTDEVTASPASVTFTSANWNTPQTVTVTGVNDSDIDGNQTTNVTVSVNAGSSDDAFDILNQTVTVITEDNDYPGIYVTPTSGLTTTEAGGSSTFTVVLNTEPAADVTIAVASSDTGEATVSTGTLTFTAANWATPQTVTVTGADEELDDGDQPFTITLSAATSTDGSYSGIDPADVSGSNHDNDTTPTSTDNSVTTNEDIAHVFGASDFPFTDLDGDSLGAVQITTLESVGDLEWYNGTAWVDVTDDQIISRADIDAGFLSFTPAADANGNDYATIGFKVSDGTNISSTEETMTVHVTPLDDDPTISGVATDSAAEETATGINGFTVTDVDGDNLMVKVTAQHGSLEVTTTTDISGTTTGSSIEFSGTVTAVNTALNSLEYTGETNFVGTDSLSLDVSDDGGSTWQTYAQTTLAVTVTPVNDTPVFTNLDATPTFTERGSAVILDADVVIGDVELDALNSASGDYAGASLVLVRNGGAEAQDLFSILSGGNLTVSGSDISAGTNIIATFDTAIPGQVTVTFADNGTKPTTALVNEVAQAIRYENSSNNPPASVQLDWIMSDGNSADAQGGGDNPGTTTGSITVSVTQVNDPPTFTSFDAVIDTILQNSTVEITLAMLAAQGDEADADGSVDAFVVQALSSGTLQIGTDLANATAYAVDSNDTVDATHFAYWQPVTDATGTLDAFTVVAKDDGGLESAGAVQAQLTVNAVTGGTITTSSSGNTVIVSPATTPVIVENNGTGTVTLIDVSDGTTVKTTGTGDTEVKDPAGDVTVENTGTGTVTVTGANNGGTVTTTGTGPVTVEDPDGDVTVNNTGTGTVTVTDVNTGGTVTTSGTGPVTVEDPDGDVTVNNTGTGTVTVIDVNTGGTVTTGGTGPVTIDDPDGDVTVHNIGDGTVTVTNVNTGGTVTTSGTKPVTVADPEGDITVNNTGSATVTVTDVITGGTVTTGGTGPVTIDDPDGDITVNNTGTGTVTVTDVITGGTVTTGGTGPVTLADPDGDITVNNTGTGTVTVTEVNAGGTVTTSGTGPVTLADPVGDITVNNSGSGTVTVTNLTGNIIFSGSGDVTLDTLADAATLTQNGTGKVTVNDPVGDITIDGSGAGPITINSFNDDETLTHTGVGTVTLANPDGNILVDASSTGTIIICCVPNGATIDNPSGADIVFLDPVGSFTVTNSGSGNVSTPEQPDGATYAVNNTGSGATNINPEIDGGNTATVNVSENSTAVTTVVATDADTGDTVTYSLTGGADQNKFSINATTGVLKFISAPNYEAPADSDHNNTYVVDVTASDNNGGLDTQTITATVTDVNENHAPVISSNLGAETATIIVAENRTAVTTVTASDADSDTVTYSITGGADQNKFSINTDTGALTFISAPNFEAPTDIDHNNTYVVEVIADDSNGGTDTQTITVNVTDVSEGGGGGYTPPEPELEPDTEPDTDGDGVPDSEDPDQLDIDGDGIPDSEDLDQKDSDGDGAPDSEDVDIDGDGIPNSEDDDSDGDGIPNTEDPDQMDSDGDGIVDSQDTDSDLFDGDDQSGVDDGINTGLRQTRNYRDTTIDGAPATTGTTTDRDTGETVHVICLNPVAAGTRQDDDDTSDDVDVQISSRVRLSMSDNQGLIAAERSGSSRADLTNVLDRNHSGNPDEQGAFLDQLFTDADSVDVVELTPTYDADNNDSTRLQINFDEGDTPQVIIIDLSHWEGDSLPEIEVSGQGHVVIRGAGHFFGASDELADNPELDNDNILGDDNAQILFFGPGDDLIHGSGGNDIVASSGGVDHLYGDSGDDIVIGGADADVLFGGAGNDTLQGGLSDAGTWQFSLNPEQGLHLQFSPSQIELPETVGILDTWLYQGQDWSADGRLDFTSADHNTLTTISSLYHAVTAELPTQEELNNIVSWNMDSEQLAEVAYTYYQNTNPIQAQEISSQVSALFSQVWGEGTASADDIQLGSNYILDGGSWSQGLLAMALHDTHRQQIENTSGDLVLTQDYVLDETGWSGDISNDQLFGGDGDDLLIGGYGSDLLDGGAGNDTALQVFNLKDYQLRINSAGDLQLVQGDNTDTLRSIETVRFGDQEISSQCSNMSAEELQTVAALYQLITDQTPTLENLNAYSSSDLDAETVAQQMLTTGSTATDWNALDNRAFVAQISERVLTSPLNAADLDYWQGQLDSENLSRAEGAVLCLGVQDYQNNLFVDQGMLLGA